MTKKQAKSTPCQPTVEEIDKAYTRAALGADRPPVVLTPEGLWILNDTNEYELTPWIPDEEEA